MSFAVALLDVGDHERTHCWKHAADGFAQEVVGFSPSERASNRVHPYLLYHSLTVVRMKVSTKHRELQFCGFERKRDAIETACINVCVDPRRVQNFGAHFEFFTQKTPYSGFGDRLRKEPIGLTYALLPLCFCGLLIPGRR
ncbi:MULTISPECIES: hypothetical protein [unclassified Leucobacter]|uniref:hypothetical protein n=1 Tax=unclassified Leucobacter TaxID=2621730 RepID=UPI0012E061ED|nr:hypothetical protein [Leucobacter sp. Ag1]